MARTFDLEQEIVSVLMEAGDKGLSLANLSRHVFNRTNTLFDDTARDEVGHDVRLFVKRNVGNSYSLLERCDRRGYYRLNMNSSRLKEQRLRFYSEE